MASKRHRKLTRPPERSPRDRIASARRYRFEQEIRKEADMEARTAPARPRTVTATCRKCGTQSQFEVTNGIPVAQCPSCEAKVTLRQPMGNGFPNVVTR